MDAEESRAILTKGALSPVMLLNPEPRVSAKASVPIPISIPYSTTFTPSLQDFNSEIFIYSEQAVAQLQVHFTRP